MKKLFKLLLVLGFVFTITSCNVTNRMGAGDTPFSTVPTHIEFWNGAACMGSYDNATVRVASVHNSRLLGAPITWFPLAKPAANPPPLLFCTNTRSVSKIAAITIKIVINTYICL